MTAAVEVPQDSSDPSPLDKELDRIRQRRTGQTGFFRGTFDDWTLVFGVIAGAVFFGGMMVMSTGLLASDSIIIDQTLSKTPLDTGGECTDRQGEVWINIWASHDEVVAKSNNAPDGSTMLGAALTSTENEVPLIASYEGGWGDIRLELILDEEIPDGMYSLKSTLYL